MKTIIDRGYIFSYDIVKKVEQKNPIIIRVKDKKYLQVSVNQNISVEKIEELLKKKIDSFKDRLPKSNTSNVIHVRGIGYTPEFIKSNIPFVKIMGDKIIIAARDTSVKAYKEVLFDYYKQIINDELNLILDEARRDFKEIVFPTISIHYFTGRFADCDIANNHIRLSSNLAKYSYKNIKVTLYHELCHLLVPNHSKKFYEVFERKYKNAKEEDFLTRKAYYPPDCL